jgi:hypothetical protein
VETVYLFDNGRDPATPVTNLDARRLAASAAPGTRQSALK